MAIGSFMIISSFIFLFYFLAIINPYLSCYYYCLVNDYYNIIIHAEWAQAKLSRIYINVGLGTGGNN